MKQFLKITFIGLITLLVFYGLVKLVSRTIDKSIDNQNIMLCKSAKKSWNKEYLEKCEEYYKTGDIIYMRIK